MLLIVTETYFFRKKNGVNPTVEASQQKALRKTVE